MRVAMRTGPGEADVVVFEASDVRRVRGFVGSKVDGKDGIECAVISFDDGEVDVPLCWSEVCEAIGWDVEEVVG